MKKIRVVLLLVVFYLLSSSISFALEKPTHAEINKFIATNSMNGFSLDIYLRNQLGFVNGIKKEFKSTETKKVWEWIRDGGQCEDEPAYTRSRNHFHDPLKTWDQAGLNSGIFTGISSALWIQDQTNRRSTDLGGDWSWRKAREFYYAALTGYSLPLEGFEVDEDLFTHTIIDGSTNMNEADRNRFFAWTFRAVGQTMHLVQSILLEMQMGYGKSSSSKGDGRMII